MNEAPEPTQGRTCKCGCGKFPGKTFEYARGHKPKGAKQAKPKSALATEVSQPEEPLVEEETVTLEATHYSLNATWQLLSLSQKAAAIQHGIVAD